MAAVVEELGRWGEAGGGAAVAVVAAVVTRCRHPYSRLLRRYLTLWG